MDTLFVKMARVEDADKAEIRSRFSDRLNIVFWDKSMTREETLAALAEASILLGSPDDMKDLAVCRKLKFMQLPFAGIDGVVKAGCFPKDAVLCCSTGQYGPPLADIAVGMIHAITFSFMHYREAGRWTGNVQGKLLEGATVVILGAGDIGTCVAERLRPSVMDGKIIGVRRTDKPLPPPFDETALEADLDRLLPEADVLVMALPGTDRTAGIMNEKRLRAMKDDAILINVGRGSALDCDALAGVMAEGRLAGAGLDVTNPEPLPAEHPLWKEKRCIITPHIAGQTYRTGSRMDRRMKEMFYENIRCFLDGEPMRSVCSLETGYSSGK